MAVSNSQETSFEDDKYGNFPFQFKLCTQPRKPSCHAGEFSILDCNHQTVYWAKAFEEGESKRARNVIATLNKLEDCPNTSKILAVITGNEKIPIYIIVADCAESVKWSAVSGQMTSADIQHYAYQLFIALDACHSRNIVHGSVNTSSVIIDGTKRLLKLTEWEDAEEHRDGKTHGTSPNSLYFQSPELLLNFRQYDCAVDLWAAGCVIAGAIFKVPYVFDGGSRNEQIRKIALVLDASRPDKDSYLKLVTHGKIGSGVSAKVYRVKSPEDSHDYAIKFFEDNASHNLWQELHVLKHLDGCPNINRCLGYVLGEKANIHCLVFEFVPIQHWGQIFYKLAQEDIAIYVYQMLLALQGCHSRGIMHRDIKPSNMLFDHYRRKVYLTDWGQAAFYKEGATYDTHVGTRKYCSPELLLRYPKHTYAIDIWPIGCILASAIFRMRYIVDGESREDQMLIIVKLLGSDSLLNYCKKYGISSSCLNNWEQFLGHHRTEWGKFITENNIPVATDEAIDLLDKLIVFDPEMRLTASEALKHPFLNKFQHSFT
nr:CMGC:CK2 protein kinase [Hymenolepis microstoma]